MKTPFFLMMGALFLQSCLDESPEFGMEDVLLTNTPISTNVAGAFTYSINGKSHSDTTVSMLQFDSESFDLALTVVNHNGGTLNIEIFENDSTVSFSQEVTSGAVVTETPPFKPAKIRLVMNDFSGLIELAMGAE